MNGKVTSIEFYNSYTNFWGTKIEGYETMSDYDYLENYSTIKEELYDERQSKIFGEISSEEIYNIIWNDWASKRVFSEPGQSWNSATRYVYEIEFIRERNEEERLDFVKGEVSLFKLVNRWYELITEDTGPYQDWSFWYELEQDEKNWTLTMNFRKSAPKDKNKDMNPTYYAEIKGTFDKTPGVVKEEITGTAGDLRGVVSSWYFILRNLALLVLMLLLIYSGIRIVIGSTAGEKAKYKERLMDWFVAICLVFIMHYIMIFAVKITENITDLIMGVAKSNGNVAIIELTKAQYDAVKDLKIDREKDVDLDGDGEVDKESLGEIELYTNDAGKEAYRLLWKTDLAGFFRIRAQATEEGTGKWAGFALCYVVLVLYTLFFSWSYLKRVLYMAFLTMIAPLVAMTYPIDKITDGKAQAFDAWLKEYIFNLLIQPMHLLLYGILVSSAYVLATKSPIYALVAVGFMMPAEKLVRRFFGFEKAKTPGLLGGAAGAALAWSGLQSLVKHKPSGGNNSANSGKGAEQNKVKFANKNGISTMDAIAGAPAPSGGGNAGTLTKSNASSEGGTPTYDSRLTQDQIDEMKAEGVKPGDSDYDSWLQQYGITPNHANSESPDKVTSENEERTVVNNAKPKTNATATNNVKSGKSKRSIGRAIGSVASSTGRQLVGKALTGIHPLRLAGKIAAGATVGTAGLLLGVASGDPSKAFQYATGGALAGSSLAGALSKGSILDTNELKEEAMMGYYGEDYKDKKLEEQEEKFIKNRENINYLRQTMGVTESKAREILETTGRQCFSNGITSKEDVATIHKLTSSGTMSFEQAVAARTYAKKRLPSDPDQMTAKSVDEYIRRWTEEYRVAGYANPDKLAERAFQLAVDYDKAESGLTKNP